MQVRRAGFAAANGKLYALGGQPDVASPNVTAAIYEYDPAGDTWSAHGQLPRARRSPAVAEVGGHLFVIGGASADGTPLDWVDEGVP